MSAGSGKKAIVAAFLANLGIALAKLVGFLVTGASSMLSEAIHSVADTGNQGLLLLGRARSGRSADSVHPFGYGRERFFWAFVVALVLFALGAVFAIVEGVEKILHPEPLREPAVALAILGVALVLESLSLRTAVAESNAIRRGASWWRFLRNAKIPELPIVLLEDTGALTGLLVAFAAVGATIATGNPLFDGVGSIIIGVVLGAVAVFLSIETKSLLIGESASEHDGAAIREAVRATPGVVRLIHERTEHLGPDEILLAAKIAFDPGFSVAEVAAAIDRVEAAVRAAVPTVRLIYLEPDLDRDPEDSRGG
jgi:cation diffusion facilitator family transporter